MATNPAKNQVSMLYMSASMLFLFWEGIAYSWVLSLSLSSIKEDRLNRLMYMKGDLGGLALFLAGFLFVLFMDAYLSLGS